MHTHNMTGPPELCNNYHRLNSCQVGTSEDILVGQPFFPWCSVRYKGLGAYISGALHLTIYEVPTRETGGKAWGKEESAEYELLSQFKFWSCMLFVLHLFNFFSNDILHKVNL